MAKRIAAAVRRHYDALWARLAERGFRTAVAGMTLPNNTSVSLHRAMGFEPVGTCRRIGWKHGTWHDVPWAQRTIAPGRAAARALDCRRAAGLVHPRQRRIRYETRLRPEDTS